MLSDERIRELWAMGERERLALPDFDISQLGGIKPTPRLCKATNNPYDTSRLGVLEFDNGYTVFGKSGLLGDDSKEGEKIVIRDSILRSYIVAPDGSIFYNERYVGKDDTFSNMVEGLERFSRRVN